ncbi:MAG: Exonuclease small subunit [Candidatus Saccharibacteria bacterium]|jgi:exodeoxyribonuclease VII small subunit|nr:Exonuclease small subunit [Candidatus Saccharibacteria bacterium]
MSDKPFEFEKSIKELEEITLWFESTDVDLDQGLVKFERGMELAGQLKSHLATVENRVEKIKQRFTAGAAASTDTEATSEFVPADTDQTGLFGQ